MIKATNVIRAVLIPFRVFDTINKSLKICIEICYFSKELLTLNAEHDITEIMIKTNTVLMLHDIRQHVMLVVEGANLI